MARVRGGLGLGLGLMAWGAWIAAIDPLWETVDDPVAAMCMLGFGVAARGLADYPFGNVAWAGIVQGLAAWAGLQAYGLAVLGAFGLAGAGVWVALRGERAPGWLAAAGVIVLFARPLAQPQFTVLAGMATVAGVLLVAGRPEEGGRWRRATGWGLLVIGAWVRPLEAALVGAIAAPWLPWRAWLTDRRERAWALGAVGLLALTSGLDALAHAGPTWELCRAYGRSFALAVCDYNLGSFLAARPAVLAGHGVSANDLALLGAYFHADAGLNALGGLRWGEPGMERAAHMLANLALLPESLGVWSHRPLWPLAGVLLVGGLTAAPGRRRLAMGLALLAGAHVALVLLGRPMPPRVAFAPVALLAACALLEVCRAPAPGQARRRWLGVALVLAAVAALGLEWRARQAREPLVQQAQALVARLDPAVRHLVWADFPFHDAYRVLERDPRLLAQPFTPLGWPFQVPNVRAADLDAAGRGWWQRLQAGEPVRLVASQGHVSLLATYAREHTGRKLVARPLGSPLVVELRLAEVGR
ncbi:MAG: hypothetical protein VKQ33_06730 [Candidatus Sericytochromatia bacterium]|nr:hypothetical protein [Candidatus Sericytochromatia bacterium]